MRYALFLFLCLSGVKCQKESEQSVLTETPTPSKSNDDFFPLKGEALPQPEPHRYHVRLTWTKPETVVDSWIIQKKDSLSGFRTLAEVTEASSYLDEDVRESQRIEYKISPVGDPVRPAETVEVWIPCDLEKEGIIEPKDIRISGRLFLKSSSLLRFGDQPVTLQAAEVLFENARIESFSLEEKAPVGQDGLAGGFLRISAQKASGRLNLGLLGQKGGDGLAGEQGASGRVGRDGKPAELRWQPVTYIYGSPIERTLKNGMRPECHRAPTNGQPGERGAAGNPRRPGHRGGNSAKAWIEVDDAKDFVLVQNREAGRGGPGGLGGAGGPGGAGGRAGKKDSENVCPEARAGTNGAAGASGPQGLDGPPGELSPICIRLGTYIEGDCSSWQP